MAVITETEQASVHAAANERIEGNSAHGRYTIVEAGALVDASAVLGPHVHIGASVVIGARCRIESGACIGAGTTLEDGVHIGPNVTFCADPLGVQGRTIVKRGASIGANATVAVGVVIGTKARVRPGTAVIRTIPPGAIVEGNPASIVGYVDTLSGPLATGPSQSPANCPGIEQTAVNGVCLHHFPVIHDLRGKLTVGEFDRHIPFAPQRFFIVFDVPSREIRGEHAHIACQEFLICVQGSCSVVADDGERRVEILLDDPSKGLHLPAMTWRTQYRYSADAKLLVFASLAYDPADYIRDYGDFLRIVAGT